jgi:hypothetical protein
MPDLLPVTVDEVVAEIEREIKMRERVYPSQVRAHNISRDTAERRIELMREAIVILRQLEALWMHR